MLLLVLKDAGRLILGGVARGPRPGVDCHDAALGVPGVRRSPADPWSFGGAAVLLMAASIAAIWRPATRAIGIEPWKALKAD